ncbi:MAG TPA: anti-sigma factor [Gaiellaceae bacterium]|nr:anti-sigma factor [Gaiellaceae bacterium]
MDLHELTAGYALDALDADDRARYEDHLATCEPCRDELQGFWRVSASLGRAAGGPQPPPSLRARILEQARAERPNVVPLRRRLAVPALSSAAAAAAVAAIGLGIWASSLSGELDDLRGQAGGDREAIAVLADPNHRSVRLAGADGRLVVSTTGKAALILAGLEAAPAGKTYEIWVIEDGKPSPAGLFESASTRTVLPLTRPVSEDAVVAVTLEPEGGVELPTGTPLFTTSST